MYRQVLIFLFLVCLAGFAQAKRVVVEDFESYEVGKFPRHDGEPNGFGKGWGIFARNFLNTDIYKVRLENGNKYLEAFVDDRVSSQSEEIDNDMDVKITRITKEHHFDFRALPYVRWKWRVHEFPSNSQEDVQYLNDSAAAVYIVFFKRGLVGSQKIIQYIWSRVLQPGRVFPNPSFNESFPTYFKIIRSGEGPSDANGQPLWVDDEVNIQRDFQEIILKNHPQINESEYEAFGVLISSDANNTNSSAKADYDDIFVSSSPTLSY
ncbi:MAG: DUF3047 domain-containing protein [Deltaproteobacteria bacterium]|nr:DUF3047 domain-containing protein [Deltaproteobacteria bacterium]